MTTYTETQRFNQWWLWAVLAIPLFEVLAIVLSDYQTLGEVRLGSFIALILVGLVVLLFLVLELNTTITDSGIQYRFFPFQIKYKNIRWDDISSAEVRTYRPLKEYGGWGIRYSFKNGKAINVKGKTGLQLVLKNGKRLLIGTNNEGALRKHLHFLKQHTSIEPIQ